MNKESIISSVKTIFFPLIIIWKYFSLKKEVMFKLEGNLIIKLPTVNLSYFLSKKKISFIENNYSISERVDNEALLRKVVFELIDSGLILKSKHIVDIGSWIGDNSIVWAGLIKEGGGSIYAIDPSPSNIIYGESLCEINNLSNIHWINEVCSNISGAEIFYRGNINHCDFNRSGIGKKYFKTTKTIDSIVPKSEWDKFSLIHLDVEHLEEEVLLGAMQIVSHSKPIIIFEQQISDVDPNSIYNHIKKFNYDLYMINEVPPGGRLDTRNFIAIQNDVDISEINQISLNRFDGCWPAVFGPSLIKFN